MKVILDVNHPGDVHFIKNLYQELIAKGHHVLVVASKKPLTYELLEEYHIPFKAIGSYGSTNLSKAINWFWLNLKMILICLRFRPEVMMGTVAFRAAFAGWFLRIRTYCFDDTEHAREQTRLITPFTTYFVTPINYSLDFGKKHLRYEGYHELAYLHPDRFKRDRGVLSDIGLVENEVYTVVRFVSWNATHDNSNQGISDENKKLAIQSFAKFGKVFITSETQLPEELHSYKLSISPGQIHHLIANASLVFGESSTMASEAACLGVPAIFIDDYGRCYTKEQEERFALVHNYKIKDQNIAIEKGMEILKEKNDDFKLSHQLLLDNKIDVTEYQLNLLFNSSTIASAANSEEDLFP